MSWEQDSGPVDHDIPNESLYRFAISNMYNLYDDYDDDDNPVNKTTEDCKAEYRNQTDYLQQHYPNGFCNVTFDSILCWPPTPFNETATVKCFKYLFRIRYNDTQNATRRCDESGNWAKQNYDVCQPLIIIPEDNATQSFLYFLGFTLSLFTLVIAVAIFIYFKELHCLRNKIHVNLMFSYIIMYSTWIVMLILINYRDDSIIVCGFGTTLLHYSHVSTFFWMFVEGMYLYNLVVKTFKNKIFKLRMYASIGWGIPLISIVIWAVVKSFLSDDRNCPWLYDDSVDWIYLAPPLLVVFLNLIFLFRIMWVLITKLRSTTGVETQQHYKAAKALFVLIPLLGVTWVVTIYVPSTDNLRKVFESLRSILLSTQGLTISLCYCFLNTEVQHIIKHHFDNWKERRSLGPRSQLGRKSGDWHSGMNNNRHTEWTLVSASEVEAAIPNNHTTETTETTIEMNNEEG